MGCVEYWNDPAAPQPNSLVPACGVLAADGQGRILLERRCDTGQWAIPMGKFVILVAVLARLLPRLEVPEQPA